MNKSIVKDIWELEDRIITAIKCEDINFRQAELIEERLEHVCKNIMLEIGRVAIEKVSDEIERKKANKNE